MSFDDPSSAGSQLRSTLRAPRLNLGQGHFGRTVECWETAGWLAGERRVERIIEAVSSVDTSAYSYKVGFELDMERCGCNASALLQLLLAPINVVMAFS